MRRLIAVIALMCVACMFSTAQIIERSKDKAKDKTNQRADEKIEDGIDQSLDKIEDLFKRKKKTKKSDDDDGQKNENNAPTQEPNQGSNESPANPEQTQDQPMDMPFPMGGFGGGPVEVDEEYHFQHSVAMRVDMYDKKGQIEESLSYVYFLSDDGKLFGMEGQVEGMAVKMVYELERHRMISMSTSSGGNMGFVMDTSEVGADVEQDEASSFKKTGRERVILNRNCEEWVNEEDGNEYQVWITKDSRLAFSKAYAEMSRANKKGASTYADYPEGFVMEMTSTDKKTGEKTVMVVTSINEDQRSTISTAGYQFMSLSPQN